MCIRDSLTAGVLGQTVENAAGEPFRRSAVKKVIIILRKRTERPVIIPSPPSADLPPCLEKLFEQQFTVGVPRSGLAAQQTVLIDPNGVSASSLAEPSPFSVGHPLLVGAKNADLAILVEGGHPRHHRIAFRHL